MARRDEEVTSYHDTFIMPPTFLPLFPDKKAILAEFPGVHCKSVEIGMTNFLPWVDFTLENPDEIWEISRLEEKRFYHYINYLEEEGRVPAFAVELCALDEGTQINGYSLILREENLGHLRGGHLVYCRSREWEREQLVRSLNEQALMKYEEDLLSEARELIDNAIRLSINKCAYLFNNRGLICWKMSNTEQAKQDFLESISLDRNNGDPYFNMGLIYFDENDYARALYYLQRAAAINPTDSQFLTELAHLYLELDQEAQALKLFRQAEESDPADSQVDFHLGHYFLYKKARPRNAIKHYCQGLEKDPDDQFALADLAVAHWIVGNKRKTRQISRSLRRKPRLMPYTISRLVYLNVQMGEYDSALDYYHQALDQTEPFEPEWLHYNAALVYAKTGRSKQALDILDLAVKAGGEAVIKRAMSDKALRQLKTMPDFKRLIKHNTKRGNR
jgi:tetratricopeptide (TPR) repeat protein